jgi:hypothetical protein
MEVRRFLYNKMDLEKMNIICWYFFIFKL